MDNAVVNYGYETFLKWAYSEYIECKYLQLLPRGIIILSRDNNNFHQVKVLDIFSSGWNWHIERLYPAHIKYNVDYSRAEYVQFQDEEYFYYVKAIPRYGVDTDRRGGR